MRVKKRSGALEEFQIRKVSAAMLQAFAAAGSVPKDTSVYLRRVVDKVIQSNGDIVDVEAIQDGIQNVLLDSGQREAAQAFIIYRHERKKLREKRRKPDPNALSNYIHVGKYAGYLEDQKRRELYPETVNRVKAMHLKKFPDLAETIEWAFDFVHQKKVLPSMRSMQFGGKAIEVHNGRIYNCSFTLIDRPRVFQEIFFLLLCGAGVGFSVQWEHVERLPALAYVNRKTVVHHVIEDSIEGWADAVGALVESFLGGYWVEFSYHKIRPEGSLLKTSGGLAPGHLGLRDALENIRSVWLKAQGRQLRPVECHDTICFIAEAVLAGGIRRSSLLSLFSPTDTEMMYCKDRAVFDPMKGINKQREMANNSVVLLRNEENRAVFDRAIKIANANFGDPGFYFTDSPEYGPNPCGEIGMWPRFRYPSGKVETGFSFCNLCEVNAAACQTEDEFLAACQAASIIGTLQASYTTFPYLTKTTELIAQRDALLGVSLMGMMDNPSIAFDPKLQRTGAKLVVTTNEEIASRIGINPGARCTTIKPGGTSAKAAGGIGSGIHPHWARRIFQRVTANPNEPYAKEFRRVNPHMVEVKPNGDWSIIFPVEVPEDAKTVKGMPASEFLEYVFLTYENWIVHGTAERSAEISPGLTHNVSCTVTIQEGELPEVLETVWNNRHRIAAMSFVPYVLDKLFPFAPKEEVSTPTDEAKWNNLIENYRPVDWSQFHEERNVVSHMSEGACVGNKCEVT
jgi:ribonucleoside-triphosphate reductase